MLGRARVPNIVKFLEVEPSGRGIVRVRDSIPGIGTHAGDDRTIVRDQISRGTLRRLGSDVADVDTTRKTATHCDKSVAVAHDPRRLVQQNTHFGAAAS